jgi:PAS domain S-box-containing protein
MQVGYFKAMENAKQSGPAGKAKDEVHQFKESFETFNKIITNLQRQYLSLENEYSEQGRQLAEINRQLRQTIADNRVVTSFLNSILASLTSGVIVVSSEGIISHFNQAARRIIGIPIAHALGKKYDEAVSAKKGSHYSALNSVMSGIEFDSEEKSIINGSGEEIPVSVSTSLLRDESNNCYGAVEIFFDLTKIKKLEAEVSRIQTLAALGEMAATVAHEVRNPLGGIGGFAALLKRDVQGDPDKLGLVDKIITGVNNLDRTVTALLDYTRRDQLNLRAISLTRLIEETVEYEQVDHNGSDKIEMDIQIENRDLKIKCDSHLMQQVLLNLLRNSREAMPDGGIIKIRAGTISREDSESTLSTVGIEIEDTGHGIPEDVRDKIFRPFYTTKSKRTGSGLGLASVWKTIQAHGGRISVSSEMGRGSTFKIHLPLEELPLGDNDEV